MFKLQKFDQVCDKPEFFFNDHADGSFSSSMMYPETTKNYKKGTKGKLQGALSDSYPSSHL